MPPMLLEPRAAPWGPPAPTCRWYEENGGYAIFHRLSFIEHFDNIKDVNWHKELHKVEVGGQVGAQRARPALGI